MCQPLQSHKANSYRIYMQKNGWFLVPNPKGSRAPLVSTRLGSYRLSQFDEALFDENERRNLLIFPREGEEEEEEDRSWRHHCNKLEITDNNMATDRHSSLPSASPEGNNMFLDILQETPLFGHRKSTGILGSIIYFIILAGYAILGAGAPWIFHPIKKLIPELLCSCDVVLLLVTGIFQQYLVYQVQKIRLQGYYSFSQKLKHIVRLPFATTAYGTVVMLLVMVWKPYISILSTSSLFRIIMLVICAGCFMSAYVGEDTKISESF